MDDYCLQNKNLLYNKIFKFEKRKTFFLCLQVTMNKLFVVF